MTDEGQQDPLSLSLKLIVLKAEMLSFEIPDSHITYSATLFTYNQCLHCPVRSPEWLLNACKVINPN